MPVYQSICLACGKYHEYIRHFAQCRDTPACCGAPTDKRILSAPMMRADIAPWDAYESPATGKHITSYAERREDMKAAGCRDWEGQDVERREAGKRKAEDEAKEDAKLDATVRTAWASLSPSKKAAALAGS
jgi:hypothetical protein